MTVTGRYLVVDSGFKTVQVHIRKQLETNSGGTITYTKPERMRRENMGNLISYLSEVLGKKNL